MVGKFAQKIEPISFPVISTAQGDVAYDGVFIIKNEDAFFSFADSINDAHKIRTICFGGNHIDDDVVEYGNVTLIGEDKTSEVTPEYISIVSDIRHRFYTQFVSFFSPGTFLREHGDNAVTFADKVDIIRHDRIPSWYRPRATHQAWAVMSGGQIFIVTDGNNRQQTLSFVENAFHRGLQGISVAIIDFQDCYSKMAMESLTQYDNVFTIK